MIAILEKYEHKADFHQIVDFVEASHLRYALTINPTVYVSFIRQFWSTARIETTDEGTKILATVDGEPRTISESSIRRNLKLRDEVGISSLLDAELFENLILMGYNILPNQKFSFQKGKGSRTPIEPHHTPSPKAQQTSPTSTLSPSLPPSSALPPVADEPASPIGDDSQGEACPTDFGLEAEQNRANINKTSTLPSDSTPRDEMALKITAQDLEISALKAMIKHLEDRDGEDDDPSGEDAIIKDRRLEIGDEACIERSTEKGSNDTKEMVNVLTSLDAASVLSSRVQVSVPPVAEVATVSIPPAGKIPTIRVPTGNGMVPTASPIYTTATESTPTQDEKMVREDQKRNEQIKRDAEIARIHAEEELQMMVDGLDRSNEMIAKHLQEYEQAVAELTIGEKIDLINELVKYQDHHASIIKWKTKHFKGMSLEEIREKFVPVWKQIDDFVPMGSKEEGERFKRKGLWLEQDSAKKVKTSEEVSEEDLKEMMQLVPVEEVYVEALQLWALVKETLNIRQATSDKEKELWVELKRLYEPDVEDQLWTQTQALMHDPVEWRLYDTCGVHHVLSRDQ
nr:hypothetical protein [Tanacetum cinerariifolium]